MFGLGVGWEIFLGRRRTEERDSRPRTRSQFHFGKLSGMLKVERRSWDDCRNGKR